MTDDTKLLSAQLDDLLRRVRKDQVEKCAAQVEQAGCVCYSLYRLDELDGTRHWKVSIDFRCTPPRITEHALCCPVALAEALRRMGA